MSATIELIDLPREPRAIRRFLRVAEALYRDDPRWVAPLNADVVEFLSDRNPLFQHTQMQLWVAVRDGRDVGRIAAVLDENHNRCHNDRAAFFGYFESVNDRAVSARLFAAVAEWAARRGQQRLLGPMNPTTNNECGLLVQGYDSRPVLMMTYNPPYYADLIQAEGFAKAKDLLAFYFDVGPEPLDRLGRAAAAFAQRQTGITVRPVRRKSLAEDLGKVKEVYNSAWEQNWGFVPMTDAEINFMADRLKPLLKEGLVWLAETEIEPVAFLLAMPDYNEALQPLRGRMASIGLLRAVPYLLGWKTPAFVRLITFGIKKRFRRRGIEAVMFRESLKFSLKTGFRGCECSWILEDNLGVQRLIELFGGKVYKTYRIYEKPLAAGVDPRATSPRTPAAPNP